MRPCAQADRKAAGLVGIGYRALGVVRVGRLVGIGGLGRLLAGGSVCQREDDRAAAAQRNVGIARWRDREDSFDRFPVYRGPQRLTGLCGDGKTIDAVAHQGKTVRADQAGLKCQLCELAERAEGPGGQGAVQQDRIVRRKRCAVGRDGGYRHACGRVFGDAGALAVGAGGGEAGRQIDDRVIRPDANTGPVDAPSGSKRGSQVGGRRAGVCALFGRSALGQACAGRQQGIGIGGEQVAVGERIKGG